MLSSARVNTSPPILTSTPSARPTFTRSDRLLVAGLAGFGALLAALRFNSILPLNGDNAVYLLLARNLATGAPYDNAGFPWGYPVLLTPGAALFGPTHLLEAIPWLKLISIAAFLLGLVLLYLLFRTRHGRVLAFLTVALFAANDITLVYTNDLMTELPYVAAVAGALLFWQRRIDPPPATDAGGPANPGRRAWIGAALLLALPYYLRTIGMALLAAAPLTLLWRRRARAVFVLALALVALALPWAVFSATTDPNRNYTAALWLREFPGSRDGVRALADAGVRLGIVSNADGLIGQRLAEKEILQVGPGPGVAVECVIDSGNVGVMKPDPRIFHIALDAMDLKPEDAWYVGDMAGIDIVGARKAGLWPVLMDPFSLHLDADYDRVASLTELAERVSAR